MKVLPQQLRLYAVTDRTWLNGRRLADVVAQAIDGGATFVQLREKCLDEHDLLVLTDGSAAWFNGQRIDNPNTHGTGCTLSSAIASNLAKGYDLETAVRRAKAYISGALAAMLDLGHGSGPMNHAFALDNEWSKEAEA